MSYREHHGFELNDFVSGVPSDAGEVLADQDSASSSADQEANLTHFIGGVVDQSDDSRTNSFTESQFGQVIDESTSWTNDSAVACCSVSCSFNSDSSSTDKEHSDSSNMNSTAEFLSNCESLPGLQELPRSPTAIRVAMQSKDCKMSIQKLLQLYRNVPGASRPDELRSFVEDYCETVIHQSGPRSNKHHFASLDAFLCPICCGILIEPVTIQCGHSYCRKCLQRETCSNSCRRCKHVLTSIDLGETKLNVVLDAMISKWLSSHVKAATLRNEGNEHFSAKNWDSALAKYAEALSLAPADHLTLGNRSHVFLTTGKSEEALNDVDAAIKNCPLWAKGYIRKALVLVSLGRFEEAFINLTLCAFLLKPSRTSDDAGVISVKSELSNVLHRILTQAAKGFPGSRRPTVEARSLPPMSKVQQHPKKRTYVSEDLSDEGSSGEESVKQLHYVRLSSGKIMRTQSETGGASPFSSYQAHRKMMDELASQGAAHLTKLTNLFERALQEVRRLQSEVIDKQNKVADTPRSLALLAPDDMSSVSASDAECTLCYRLLYQPVATICGHTYCRSCLERSLDHSPACPLCKSPLDEYLAMRRLAVTNTLDVAIQHLLPNEYRERVQQHHDEIEQITASGSTSNFEIPIFVCTMAFPTVPCPLHVFEPRYRLMIRRAVESGSHTFGMCCYLHDAENNYAEFGTLLHIRNVQYFADGRSVVDTVGKFRFKILKKFQKDGYNMASIELLKDRPIEEHEQSKLQQIHDEVHTEAITWLDGISQVLRQRIISHFGPMPEIEENWLNSQDGPSWTWWLLAILPLDTKAQLAILSMNSLLKRLESIRKVLNYVKSNNM